MKILDHEIFQRNFDKWTSNNKFIDKFIQEAQLNAKRYCQILEWVPYSKLNEIKYLDKGGFSIIYEAIWLDRPIKSWSNGKNEWLRISNKRVVLKNLDKSFDLNNEFLNEV